MRDWGGCSCFAYLLRVALSRQDGSNEEDGEDGTGEDEDGEGAAGGARFADPAAALVGRRFGKHPLVNGRTLEGSGAFFVVAVIAITAVLLTLHPDLTTGWRMPMVVVGTALAGTLFELFSFRIDDNLSIPLGTAGVAAALLLV